MGRMRTGGGERLEEIVGRFKGRRVLVAGDLILDRYIWGDVERTSPFGDAHTSVERRFRSTATAANGQFDPYGLLRRSLSAPPKFARVGGLLVAAVVAERGPR